MRQSRAICLGAALLFVTGQAGAQEALDLDLGSGLALALIRVPHGSFLEGSPNSEEGHADDERSRDVSLTKDFYLGKFPVTRREFAAFVTATGYRTEAENGTSGGAGWDGQKLAQKKSFTWRAPGFAQTETDPVTLVTHADAEAFGAWLTMRSSRRIRLPTEAEWEYAARAGTTTAYYAGASPADALSAGWFKDNAGQGTRATGQKKPNAFGLHDMSGNVYEWCADWYGPFEAGPVTDPMQDRPGGTDVPRRVLRGGSWLRAKTYGRSAARYRNTPESRNADNGFRVAADIAPLAPAANAPAAMSSSASPASSTDPAGHPTSAGSFAGGDGPIWLMGALGVVLSGLGLFLLLFRRRVSAVSSVRTRVVKDGFWIASKGLPAGTRLRYSCRVKKTPYSDVIPIGSGDETFVYTGDTPDMVQVLNVLESDLRAGTPAPHRTFGDQAPSLRSAAASPAHPGFSAHLAPASHLPPHPGPRAASEPVPEPFRGYPPAY